MSKEYAKIWRSELKNNPHLFKTKIVSLHETRKEAYDKENSFHLALNVVSNPLYINKSNADVSGKFGGGFSGHQHSRSHRLYMKKIMKGRKLPWLQGKKRPEHSKKMMGANNPNFGKRGELNPLYRRSRTDRMCCIFCKKESTVTNIKRYHTRCASTHSEQARLEVH